VIAYLDWPERIKSMPESAEKDFEKWWFDEGSGMSPQPNEDLEEHCCRVAKIAWLNGYFKGKSK
jgi:hypothetical protein